MEKRTLFGAAVKERAKPKTIAKATVGVLRSHHYLQMITLYMGSQRNATETSVEKHNTDA